MALKEIVCPKCRKIITRTEIPAGEAWHRPCYRIAVWISCDVCGSHIDVPRKGQQTCGADACKKTSSRIKKGKLPKSMGLSVLRRQLRVFAKENHMPRLTITAEVRQQIFDRDKTCVYCGGSTQVIEHVIPRARGGSDYVCNLVAACTKCNSQKGCQLNQEFVNKAFEALRIHYPTLATFEIPDFRVLKGQNSNN